MTAALSLGVKRYFKSQGDNETDAINIAIPVNIRWEPYSTFDSVELENKFAPMTIRLPLINDVKTQLNDITRVTKNMKN